MKRLLFIGIAGHAMRGLALAAKRAGYAVTGLDENAFPPGSDWLTKHDIAWTNIPDFKLFESFDEIVLNAQYPADYPFIVEAQRRGVPIISFPDFLGQVTKMKHVIAVGGTHGKTTTTAFITWLLESAGRHPDFLIGIQPFNFDASARLDGSDVVVIEGDEYKASNLDPHPKLDYYHPDVLVLTSVEMDHPDMFRDLAHVVDSFQAIVVRLPKSGRLYAWADDPTVSEVASHASAPVTAYGLEQGTVRARSIAYMPTGIEFDLEIDGAILGRLAVPLYGRHNILNSLAAVSVALGEGLTFDQVTVGAGTFKGAYRRFNVLTAPSAPITVIDDYAHHPTEVAATIEAAKLHFPGRRLIAVFRPHTYSRTRTLLAEFQAAFELADVSYITDVESAREALSDATVSGNDVASGIPGVAHFVPGRSDLLGQLLHAAESCDVILCMSVSGYDKFADELAQTSTDKYR
jgi:UDP-N-acetylmuramate--L-alanine ligase